MEGLIKRAYVFTALMLAGGAWAYLGTGGSRAGKTENWMEIHSVSKFDQYHMVSGNSPDPLVSYKADKGTYDALEAYGIVARVFSNDRLSFEVLLIASQAKASFHDPRVCFTAQGWQFTEEKAVETPTKHRGMVPVTIARIRSDEGNRWAAFCYRGPDGFASSTNQLKYQMFKYSLLQSTSSDGIFYRFIAQDDRITRQQLQGFISEYLDASTTVGNGYF
jgi:Protein of unknown function (DUF3485)